MQRNLYIVLVALFMLGLGNNLMAQCKINNTYFKEGEVLVFDLYFKYGFVELRAGNAMLKTELANYEGNQIYKAFLTTNSKGTARSVFPVDDTLTSYLTKDIVPLRFVKDAHEGKDYTREEVVYKYDGSKKVRVQTKRHKNKAFRFDDSLTSTNCTYDMLSVVYYSRALDYATMKKGNTHSVEFMSGRRKVIMGINYRGIETIKANDKKKYECIVLVMSLTNAGDTALNKEDASEAMKVYLTNDKNRMPVRMEFKLKHGATRGMLKSYKGNRYPVGSK